MNLKNKLTLFTLVPFVITAFVLIVTFWLGLFSNAEKQISATRKNLMELKKTVLKNYMDLSVSGMQHILSDTTLSQDSAQSKLQTYIQSLSYDGSNYLFAYTGNGDRIALGSNLSGVGENYWNVQDPDGQFVVQDLIDTAKNDDGYYLYHWPRSKGQTPLPKLSYTIWLPDYNWMVGTGFYIDDIDKEVAEIESQSAQALYNSLIICIIVSFCLSGLTVFNIRLVAKRIMRPLDEMNENLLEISTGQGDLTRRLTVGTKDEVGQLAASFNSFVQQIQLIVVEVLKGAFQVKSSAEHIDSRNTQIHSLVKNQNDETDMVATAVNQMATSAIEIARSAEDAATSAEGANGKSQQAISDLHSSVSEVKSLALDIKDGALAIEALEQNVSDIVSVLEVISSIAEQTNLLALNAAIEAARAGEQGRGFAVVADEVRNLASRTQDSTGEIQQTIQRLKLSADSAVNIMNASLEKSLSTVEKVEYASSDISVITDEITNITEMITQIAVASKQQHQVSEDINRRMSHIADSSGETEQLTDQSASDSHQLLALAGQLEKLVSQFKIA